MSGEERKPTIVQMVDDFNTVLVDFQGRVVSVSEMEVTRTNTPTFPVAMFALQDITFVHSERTNKPPAAVETIIAEFWFQSRKRVNVGGKAETPFWEFYNYEPLLQTVVDFVTNWKSPRGYRLKLVRMDLESTELAVMVSFTFNHIYDICPTPEEELGETRLVGNVCIPTGCDP